MKKKLILSTVLISIASVIINCILLFIDVDFVQYFPFLLCLSAGWIISGISVVLIVMCFVHRFTSIGDSKTKKIIAVLSAVVILFGIVSVIKPVFFESYATTGAVTISEDAELLEVIKDNFPYKSEDSDYDDFGACRYGKTEKIEIQQRQNKNSYRAVYYKSGNFYLNRRFAIQYSPALSVLYDDHSSITPTSDYTAKRDGLKVHVYVNDYNTNDYAVIISTMTDAIYVELQNADVSEVTIDDFIDEAINQYNDMRNTDFDNDIYWFSPY